MSFNFMHYEVKQILIRLKVECIKLVQHIKVFTEVVQE